MDSYGTPEASDWMNLAQSFKTIKDNGARERLNAVQLEGAQRQNDIEKRRAAYAGDYAAGRLPDQNSADYNAEADNMAKSEHIGLKAQELGLDVATMEKTKGEIASHAAFAQQQLKNGDLDGASRTMESINPKLPNGLKIFGRVDGGKYIADRSPQERAEISKDNPQFMAAVEASPNGHIIYGKDEDTGAPIYLPKNEKTLQQGMDQINAYLQGDKFLVDSVTRAQAVSDWNAEQMANAKDLLDKNDNIVGRFYFQKKNDGSIVRFEQRKGSKDVVEKPMQDFDDYQVEQRSNEYKLKEGKRAAKPYYKGDSYYDEDGVFHQGSGGSGANKPMTAYQKAELIQKAEKDSYEEHTMGGTTPVTPEIAEKIRNGKNRRVYEWMNPGMNYDDYREEQIIQKLSGMDEESQKAAIKSLWKSDKAMAERLAARSGGKGKTEPGEKEKPQPEEEIAGPPKPYRRVVGEAVGAASQSLEEAGKVVSSPFERARQGLNAVGRAARDVYNRW